MKEIINQLKSNKKLHIAVYLFLGVFILECTLFNYKHWFSLGYETIDASDYITEYGPGLSIDEDGIHVNDTASSFIRMQNMDFHIDNIYMDAISNTAPIINVHLYSSDAASYNLADRGATTIADNTLLTNYFDVHLSGNTDDLAIFFIDANSVINVGAIEFNKTVPFNFSFLRMAVMILLCMFIIAFRPKSELYNIKLFEAGRIKYILTTGCLIVISLMCIFIGNVINPDTTIANSTKNWWPANEEYVDLADAIIAGQLELQRTPPASLATIDNPYDPVKREDTVNAANETFDWDYAYFEGKYYCYFGVIPAVLFYVPYKLITGNDLKTWDLAIFCTIIYCIVCFYFIYQLYKKYFDKASLGAYLLSGIFLCFSSSIVYLIYLGLVYSIPIITSLMFGLFGLGLWLSSCNTGSLIRWKMVAGSVSIALIIGCRPQLVLIFILAVPIFWNETIKERLFFSKKGILNTVIVMLPFIIVGVAMMAYNAARFHSPFDFGANYNLTGNDMTHRGWVWARFPLGIFTYVFEPLNVSAAYPFLNLCSQANDYLGRTSYEPFMGGILAYNTLFVLNVLVFKLRKGLQEKKAFLMALLPSVLGLIIMLLDIQMSGITQRYLSDFSWMFAITTVIVIVAVEEKLLGTSKGIKDCFYAIIAIGVCACVILNCWNIFIDGRYFDLKTNNPELYYAVKCMLPFY